MLDFGPTAAGSASSNSMYHSENEAFTDTHWNGLTVYDESSLVWSDGSPATGVAVNIGATTQHDTSVLGLNNTPSGNHALGNEINTGIYEGTSVATDGIFTGNSGNTRYVGLQVSGLPAGTYSVYVAARNTNTPNAHVQNVYVGATAQSGDFDAQLLSASGILSYSSGNSATSEWVEESNYLKLSVTLEEGEYLNIAVVGDSLGSIRRGFLNAVQIVSEGASSKGTVIMISSLEGWMSVLMGVLGVSLLGGAINRTRSKHNV